MKDFVKALEALKIQDAAGVAEKLLAYMDGVLEWNDKVNLTAITNREDFVQKHLLDSLLFLGEPEFQAAERVADLGTGAGFPGIPLAAACPDKRFVLMDSLAKRLKIIDELCEKLGIENVETVHGRAEDLGREPEYREGFDLCVSRAVANLATLSEYCLPLVKTGGCFAAYKSADCEAEVAEAAKAIKVLGGGSAELRAPKLEGFELEHVLVCVPKERPTPKAYPRKAGTPSKTPIR